MSQFFRIITVGITAFLIHMIFRFVLKENEKQSSQNDNDIIIVRYPTVFFIVSISTTTFFLLLGIAMYLFPFGRITPTWCYVIVLVFVFTSLITALIFKIWRIEIYSGNNYFVYRTFYGRRYCIEYKDCLFYSRKDGGIKLKTKLKSKTGTKNKSFSVSALTINYEILLKELNVHNIKRK